MAILMSGVGCRVSGVGCWMLGAFSSGSSFSQLKEVLAMGASRSNILVTSGNSAVGISPK
jgi:hypothetical protein